MFGYPGFWVLEMCVEGNKGSHQGCRVLQWVCDLIFHKSKFLLSMDARDRRCQEYRTSEELSFKELKHICV